ncbi:HAMP domain-containing sensor histidine kinase [Nonomuraea sp. NPDC049784]|uniref:sensor histidine kinase n=1 Tax=Nonomuraea sp. NPDC049784 TaxID=3154361 RepID=UPI0033E33859
MAATATMAVVCVVGVVMALAGLRHQMADYRRDTLIAEAVRVSDNVRLNGAPHILSGGVSEAAQLFDAKGKLIASSPNLKGTARPLLADSAANSANYASQERCDLPAFRGRCMIVLRFPIPLDEGTWMLYAATPAPAWYSHPAQLTALVGGALLLVAMTAIGTYLIVSRTLAPVAAISHQLAKITKSDLTHRVPMPKYDDELHELAQVTNRMLDRAQAAVEQQLRFASDASHDLRSPLTAMRAQLEQAMMYPKETDWPKTADMLLGSVERQQDLVADLLQMSRLDAGRGAPHDVVNLSDLVQDELDRRPRGVDVVRRLTPGVIVKGEHIGLARLLTNLLDNAERHACSAVTVTVGREPGTAVLEVADDGEGIPAHLRETVFQRFVRLNASRVKDPGGTGLGLPIARQIAQAHGGSLTIEDSPRGARFVLRLPLGEAEAPR